MGARILEFKLKPKPEEVKPVDKLMQAIERDEAGRTPMEVALEGMKQAYTPEELKVMFDEIEDIEDVEMEDSQHQCTCQREVERQANDSAKYLSIACTCVEPEG